MAVLVLENNYLVSGVELVGVKRIRDGDLDHLTLLEDVLITDCDHSILLRGEQVCALFAKRVFYEIVESLVSLLVEIVLFRLEKISVISLEIVFCCKQVATARVRAWSGVRLIAICDPDRPCFFVIEDVFDIDFCPLSVFLFLLCLSLHDQTRNLNWVWLV